MNHLAEIIMDRLVDMTRERPMFVHFDSIGLLYLGNKNQDRLKCFDAILNGVAESGGNLIVPVFSYSFCQRNVFNVDRSPTTLGESHEFLRKRNLGKRTSDGIFSYLVFGSHPVFSPHLEKRKVQDCFGSCSLIENIFELDGWIGAIGGCIHKTTEIHHIEKKIGAPYRFDKEFPGDVIHPGGERYRQSAIFFCRDLEFSERTSLTTDLRRMYADMESENKIMELNIRGDFLLEHVPFQRIYEHAKARVVGEPHYLLGKGSIY